MIADQPSGQTDEQAALIQALLSVDRLKVKEIFTQAKPGAAPIDRIEELIAPALEWIGSEWEQGRLSLSQVYMSGRLCEEMIDVMIPPSPQPDQKQPKIAIVVLEDYHMLGKRIVYSMLRANGYNPLNYGRMAIPELVQRISQDQIEILLVSVLMLPSALRIKELRRCLNDAGHHKVKIVVGGAPFRFDNQLWKQVGADACGMTASDAPMLVRQLMGMVA